MNNAKPIQFTENQISGLKAGINDIMQGLLTLNKVLAMNQIPESAKYANGRLALHDSHGPVLGRTYCYA